MKIKLLAAGLALALSAGVAGTAFAQVKPEVLVKQRQSAMTLQGKYIGPLAGMLKGAVPFDASVAARNAAFLDALSQMPWDGFAESTKGEKSRALPVIWSDAGKFKQTQDQFRTAVGALVAATKGGNEAAVKTATGDVLKVCNGCHDTFRQN
jgi:cytochrome c556